VGRRQRPIADAVCLRRRLCDHDPVGAVEKQVFSAAFAGTVGQPPSDFGGLANNGTPAPPVDGRDACVDQAVISPRA